MEFFLQNYEKKDTPQTLEAKKGNYREIVAFSLEDEVSYSAFILHFIDNWQHNLHEKNEIHKNIYSVFFLQKKDI